MKRKSVAFFDTNHGHSVSIRLRKYLYYLNKSTFQLYEVGPSNIWKKKICLLWFHCPILAEWLRARVTLLQIYNAHRDQTKIPRNLWILMYEPALTRTHSLEHILSVRIIWREENGKRYYNACDNSRLDERRKLLTFIYLSFYTGGNREQTNRKKNFVKNPNTAMEWIIADRFSIFFFLFYFAFRFSFRFFFK